MAHYVEYVLVVTAYSLFWRFVIKEFYIRFTLLILIILNISCGRNMLGPENIPPPTDFYIPPDTILGNVDIDPVPAPDGAVFGGFGKRFMYDDKWHILVENIYHYDPDTKTLTERAGKSLLRLNDEKDIEIITQNMDYRLWDFYNRDDLIIEDNKIWYHSRPPYYIGAYSRNGNLLIAYNDFARVPEYASQYYVKAKSYYCYTYTENLVKIFYEKEVMPNQPYREETLMTYPKPVFTGGEEGSWQRKLGLGWMKVVFFKDYYYAIGGKWDGRENTIPVDIFSVTETTYKRIHKDMNGSYNSNWEIITPPWKPRTGDSSSANNLQVRLSVDGEKLFIAYGMRKAFDVKLGWLFTEEIYTDIWSTRDGLNWVEEHSKTGFDKAHLYLGMFNYYDDDRDKYVPKITPTPLEPDWARNSQNFYYKMDKAVHSIPVPYDEIREAADRGETNFVITEEHKNSYNNFLISKTHPDEAGKDDWKAIKVNNYTKSSMHWVSSTDYLFASGNKLIRFIDYNNVDEYFENTSSQSEYEDMLRQSKIWHERGNNGGYSSYSQKDCYYNSMVCKARADVMSSVLHGDIKDVYPDEAISHYILEFYH